MKYKILKNKENDGHGWIENRQIFNQHPSLPPQLFPNEIDVETIKDHWIEANTEIYNYDLIEVELNIIQ